MTKASERKKIEEEAHLTAREIQVIRLIEKEYSNRDIANELFLSERTVETHRKNVMDKLSIDSVAMLTKYAVREGITSLDA